jgi:hypothetical protein
MVDRRDRGRLWAWVHAVLFGDDREDGGPPAAGSREEEREG